MKKAFWLMALLIGISCAAQAQLCRNYMAEQNNGYAGFYVDVENQVQSGDSVCRLANLHLVLGVGNGYSFQYVANANGALQYDQEYIATGSIGLGNSTLKINGEEIGTSAVNFLPYSGRFDGNMIPSWASGPAEYVVVVEDVTLKSSSGKKVDLSFLKEANRPYPLFAFDPAGPRAAPWNMLEGDTLQVTVKFHVSPAPIVAQFAPYINRYGQSVQAAWPGKVGSDQDLFKNKEAEQKQLAQWGTPTQFDKYGGLINSSWQAKATGFYRVEQKNGFWWLISPLGNPCFYKSFATAPGPAWDLTPTTGRENLFAELPPQTGDYAAAWKQAAWGDSGVDYLAFQAVNLIRKYGASSWQQSLDQITIQRAKVWGFSGVGKFSDPIGLPYLAGLSSGSAPNAAGTSHPDVFDPAIQAQIRSDLSSQITPEAKDPLVVGWSIGNEDSALVASWEVNDVFSQEGATVPLKQALINRALNKLYGGDVQALASAWGIQAASIQDVYASNSANLPAGDLEYLREYYEQAYFQFLYKTVKSIDPNHLYLGSWYSVGGNATDADWQILSRYVDVMGYDRYGYGLTDTHFMDLLKAANKPALLGEFSFPPTYRMQRGFGAFPNAYADNDAMAGTLYAQTLHEAASNPYVVGTDWFQYRDEAISGRGPGSGPGLVYGEHFAFGLIDVTDTPKWAMIERIRQANLDVAAQRLTNTLK